MQPGVKLIGKGLSVALMEGRGTAGLYSRGSQNLHKIPHIEPATDSFNRIELSSRIKGMASLAKNRSRQRNIRGNHQITGRKLPDYLVICHILSESYTERGNICRSGYLDRPVGNKYRLHRSPLCCPEQDFLNGFWTRIGIDPYLHVP